MTVAPFDGTIVPPVAAPVIRGEGHRGRSAGAGVFDGRIGIVKRIVSPLSVRYVSCCPSTISARAARRAPRARNGFWRIRAFPRESGVKIFWNYDGAQRAGARSAHVVGTQRFSF